MIMKRIMFVRWIVCLVVAMLGFASVGQEGPKPGPEHEMLKEMEGEWTAKIKAGDAESTGKMTSKMELGGFWLVTKFEGEISGMKFEGRGMDTYDPVKRKYVSMWADSMGPFPMMAEGTYDKEKKRLTMTAEGMGPNGQPAKYRMTTDYEGKDRQVFNLFLLPSGGEEVKMMTIEYTRKK